MWQARSASLSLVLPLAAACGGGNAASQLATAPTYQPPDQTKCGVKRSQDRPLIVEWNSNDRLALETKLRQGLVAVRYAGCEMEVLSRCTAPGRYRYLGGTRKTDKVDIKDEDDLYAKLPVGAAGLAGTLERSGHLTVDIDLVGRFEAEKPSVRAEELSGDCTGATHFVYGASVGAFDFYAGASADVSGGASIGIAGAGGHSQSARETLGKDGERSACDKATPDDKTPPAQCGALIRLEVVPLDAAGTASTAATTSSPSPSLAPSPAPSSPAPQTASREPAPSSQPPHLPDECRTPKGIKKVILSRYRDYVRRSCVDGKQRPDEQVDVTIDMVIDPAGNATRVAARPSARQDVAACVAKIAATWQFCPSPEGYETKVNYPFQFEAPNAAAGPKP